jgi:hypothetical protein
MQSSIVWDEPAPHHGAGPYVLIAHTFGQCSGAFCSSLTTSAINTTGADLIVVMQEGNAGISAMSDSKSNSWIQAPTSENTGPTLRILYAKNPTVGSGHTFTSNPNGAVSMAVAAFSGANLTSPFDTDSGAKQASGTTLQPGSITPSMDNELIVFGTGDSWTGTASVDIGSILDQGPFVSNTHFALAFAYQIQTSKTAINPTFTFSNARSAAIIAAFK